MVSISLCMIVKDEKLILENCLNSVKDFVDEIIIVDTGSTDETKDIARRFTDKVFDFKWEKDFSKARNFSLSKATKDWILVLDADEVIASEDMEKITKILENTDYDAFQMIQRNYSNDRSKHRWEEVTKKTKESKEYEGYARTPIVRLFKNHKGIEYFGVVHEVVDPIIMKLNLRTRFVDVPIHHYIEKKEVNSTIERQLKYLELLEEEIKRNPYGRLYEQAAAVLVLVKKDYEKAAEYLKKAIELDYKKDTCLENLGFCYFNLNRHDEAYEIYKNLIKKGYVSPNLYNHLANILYVHEHYPQAVKYWKLAIKQGYNNKEKLQKNIDAVEKLIDSSGNN